jgi:hypothetical protein
LPLLRASVAILDRASPGNPEVVPAHASLGRALSVLGHHDAAVAALGAALAIRRARVESPIELGRSLCMLGQAHWDRNRRGDRARATELVTEARDLHARRGAGSESLRLDAERWLDTRSDPARAAAVSFFH